MKYNLMLSRDYLRFSCAHMVIGEKFYEKLHGHNYETQINVIGDQDEDNMVINFYDIKKIVKPIIAKLDHHIIIPGNNKYIEISEKNTQVIVNVPRLSKEYEFPKEDVVILPIENTTVEELSRYISSILLSHTEFQKSNIEKIRVKVSEYKQQGVSYESSRKIRNELK